LPDAEPTMLAPDGKLIVATRPLVGPEPLFVTWNDAEPKPL